MEQEANANKQDVFELKILFDGELIGRDKLEEQSRKVLAEHLANVELKTETTTSGHSLLSVKGPLISVDACHRAIAKVLIGRLGHTYFFRLIDEAGDEIRRRAYPILADLEQDLRAFVNQSIVEVLGFEWWTSLGKVDIPGLTSPSTDLRSLRETHHPLELTQFDDLVKIMTTEVAQWEDDRVLSMLELAELLEEAENIGDLKKRLARRRERFSFWDRVFARYFLDEDDWRAFKKELDFVIEIRHCVMHHRPVHHGQLLQLQSKRERLRNLLMSARESLPERERAQVREDIGHLREIYATIVREATDERDVYKRALGALYEVSDLDAVIQWLEKIDRLEQSRRVGVRETYDLRGLAFRKLRDLTHDTPDVAESFILQRLLPYCAVDRPHARVALSQLQECLVDWLNQYAEPASKELRAKVLESLHLYLAAAEPQAACWTASRIGYRTDRLVDTLWRIAKENDDTTGDTALSTLTTLGVSVEQRDVLLAELHRRAVQRGPNLSLISALARLADPSSIDVVYGNWLGPDRPRPRADISVPALEPIAGSVVLNIFRSVLDAQSQDAALQDWIWQMLADLAEKRPQDYANDFYLGLTAPACNSVLVVPQMLEWLAQDRAGEKDPEWGRHLICLRLEECVRPRQLEGWGALSESAAFDLLQHDACQDTGADLFITTKEAMVKKKAWETLFRAGHAKALDWFEAAVVPETSGFIQQTIANWFAVFRIDPLPGVVTQQIRERHDEQEGQIDSRKYAPRMAAVRMAQSAASREAFDALLDFGLTIQGQAPMQTVEALADVALCLVRNGDLGVVGELVESVVERKEEHQRIAAVDALRHIALVFPSLLSEHIGRLIPLLYDTKREAHERGTLLNTLGYLQDWPIPDELLRDLETWAREPERWVGGGSLETLARHGHLYENHGMLREVLGLRQVSGQWDLGPGIERFEWSSYIIGLLYYSHPDEFAPAIASLLQTSDYFHVPQVFRWLVPSHRGPKRPPLPQAVRDAIIGRIHRGQSQNSSETSGFRVLTELAPHDLVGEDWQAVWDQWMPDSRVALGDALGETNLPTCLLDQAVANLQALASDGQYAARRAAFRGLARQSMDALCRLCLSWSDAPSRELRQRAAEACGWLDRSGSQDGTDAFDELYQALSIDPERTVREAARRTWEERRRRQWAAQYLSRVLDTQGLDNEEMLNAWRYGEALARTGDDICIAALRHRLETSQCPPNVRYWLREILNKLQENWRRVTQEWPEPWLAWTGRIEEGKGRLLVSAGETIEISYSVWLQPKSAPFEFSDWGGAMWPVPFFEMPDDCAIQLAGNQRGRVVITSISRDLAIFRGSGPYPS